MPTTLFRRYTPGTTAYARRRTEEEWEEHRHLLTRLHQQHYTRRQMLDQLKTRDFTVTSGQLLAQMKKWDLMVYTTHQKRPSSTTDVETTPDHESPPPPYSPPRLSTGPLPLVSVDEDLDLLDAGFIGGLRLTNSAEQCTNTVDDAQEHRFSLGEARDVAPAVSEEGRASSPGLVESEVVPNEDVNSPNQPSSASYPDWNMVDPQTILQQLPTIREPWCDKFSISCCCEDLFTGQGKFSKSPELYHLLLKQASPTSLQHAWAVIRLVEIALVQNLSIDLPALLQTTILQYLTRCTDGQTKNRQANQILHHLLRLWELSNGGFPIHGYSSSGGSHSRRKNDFYSKLFGLRPSRRSPESPCFDWELISEQDVQTMVGFTVSRPSPFPLVNWSGLPFGCTDNWSSVCKEDDATLLVNTASALAQYMQQKWSETQADTSLTSLDMASLGGCDLTRVFNTLGLMAALELDEYARNLIQKNGILSDSVKWPSELKSFLETTVKTLSLNSEYAEKFRKCYWLARVPEIGIGGKVVHFGSCKASHQWSVLARDIGDYDEPRTWIERRVFSGPSSWPQPEDLATSDNMSVRSSSSINSFRRFQALALHLKLGTPHSRSIRSRSTKSKMSVDSHLSWQLENVLEIGDEPLAAREAFDPQEYKAQDDQAFEQIQLQESQK